MWHEISADVLLYVKTCATCSKTKELRVRPIAELGCYYTAARMEQVHLDIIGVLPESDLVNKYIMVVICSYAASGLRSSY